MKPRKGVSLAAWVALTVGCLLTVVLPSNPAWASLTPHQEAINDAIADGVAWLESTQIQYDSGGVEYGYWNTGFGANAASAGMGLLALVSKWEETLASDDPMDDEYIRRAANYLLDNQHGDGTWGSNINYETSSGVWGLAALLNKLPLGSTSIGPVTTAIEDAKNWLIDSQWDESCLWGSVDPSNRQYYGGFGYGSHSRPDLSNTQFALVALKAAGLDPASDTWTKGIMYVESCQYAHHADGGMWYTPDSPVWDDGSGSTGSMTGAGIWAYRLCGLPFADSRVMDAFGWLQSNYAYDHNPHGNLSYSHYYYLWSAAKAFLICDVHNEIGGLIPIPPVEMAEFGLRPWYYDFSKYLVDAQAPDGHWNTGNYNGGNFLDTAYALFILSKEVGIPYAVLVSISPDMIAIAAGGTANFTVSVENIGTEEDSYDMDATGIPSEFSWSLTDPVMNVASGATAMVPLDITPPSDLPIWMDTPYPFIVEAVSQADPGISNATTGTVLVVVQATPTTRASYVDVLLDSLKGLIEEAEADGRLSHGTRQSLLAILVNAERKKHQGLAYLEEGRTDLARNMFNAAGNMVSAFVNECEALRGKKITEGDADTFIAMGEDIAWRLHEGILEILSTAWAKPGKEPDIDIVHRIPNESPVSAGFGLHQNYPNPFNPTTSIRYAIPEAGLVSLNVYDVLGRLVRTLVSEVKPAGEHTITWNARDNNGNEVNTGVYFVRLESAGQAQSQKILLMK